jgi:hypothetical protein
LEESEGREWEERREGEERRDVGSGKGGSGFDLCLWERKTTKSRCPKCGLIPSPVPPATASLFLFVPLRPSYLCPCERLRTLEKSVKRKEEMRESGI